MGVSEEVAAAMAAIGATKLDDRGLVPIEEARAAVRAVKAFRKGRLHRRGRLAVWDADILWAALLSLEDDREFVREASRLEWKFHPRSRDNTAPWARYGDGILPWLRKFVRKDSALVNVPWCVRPCLCRIARREAFDIVFGLKTVIEDEVDGPGVYALDTVGDVDARWRAIDRKAPRDPDEHADAMLIEWVTEQPRIGHSELARRSIDGDARAMLVLKSLAQVAPSAVYGDVAAELGEVEARRAFAVAEAPIELDAAAVLAMLDGAALAGAWPELRSHHGEDAYHALRLTAARARQGDGWGVVFQRVQGGDAESAVVRVFVVGSNVSPGFDPDDDSEVRLFVEADGRGRYGLDGARLDGPCGSLVVPSGAIEDWDLRPAERTSSDREDAKFVLRLRAYLARFPDAFFEQGREAIERLGLGDDAIVVADTSAFEHVVGPAHEEEPDAALRRRPSESETYRTLAEAIALRDPARFRPAPSNVDWRFHTSRRR